MKICFNGKIIAEHDIAEVLHLNDELDSGVFETFKTIDGRIHRLDKHLNRLEQSMKILGLFFAKTENLKTVKNGIRKLLDESSFRLGSWQGKILVTQKNWWFKISPLEEIDPNIYIKGVSVDSVVEVRPFPLAKSISPLYSLHGARKNGFFERLFFTPDEYLLEGNITNVFVKLKSGIICTPKDDILLGIMREEVLELLLESGYKIEERPIHRTELLLADEIFITNTIKGVIPVGAYEAWRCENFIVAKLLQKILLGRRN